MINKENNIENKKNQIDNDFFETKTDDNFIKNEKNDCDKNDSEKNDCDKNDCDKNDSKKNDCDKNDREKNIELKSEIVKEKDKFIRIFAEFENYKKRIQKEKLNFFINANENMILDLLPVLDDFERGIKEISHSKGMMLIKNKFNKILTEKGLKKINVTKGDDFNTDIHEAITQISVTDKDLDLTGKIVEIIEAGYILGEKVIRHAKVVIGK